MFIGILSIWANSIVSSYRKIDANSKDFTSLYVINNYDEALAAFPISREQQPIKISSEKLLETQKNTPFFIENGLLGSRINFDTSTTSINE